MRARWFLDMRSMPKYQQPAVRTTVDCGREFAALHVAGLEDNVIRVDALAVEC